MPDFKVKIGKYFHKQAFQHWSVLDIYDFPSYTNMIIYLNSKRITISIYK